jgi:hypothetical protein
MGKMRRRSFVASLTGGVLGAALPGRIGAGELQTADRNRLITLNDYEFISPEGWAVQRDTNQLLMQNPQSGCQIQLIEPQPTSGSLEQVSRAAFELMYAGWQYRKTGEQQFLLSTGVLPKGLEYFMTEAEMSKEGAAYGAFQNGAALIVKAGSQLVVIAVRHPTLMSAHRECWVRYETWRRFFNSFTVRNTPIVREAEGELATRIVGRWAVTEGLAVKEHVFAANGAYASGGAFGSSASGAVAGVSGDGRYSVVGDQLIMSRPGGTAEQVRFRFERVNRGGTGWTDRLRMLKKDAFGENEVSYERR